MRSTNIAELKNKLTQYLREVREGEEIIVCDRRRPFAKIVPLGADADDDHAALVAGGLLRPAARTLPRSFWSARRPRLAVKAAVAAITADREDD